MVNDVKKLLDQAIKVYQNAYAPYSEFSVGACIESDSGNLYTGCNVENAAYGLTLCAETSAISAMIAGGDKKIKRIIVVVKGPGVSTPCGACRQRLMEFALPNTQIELFDREGNHQSYLLEQLLPNNFGPKDLR